MAIVHLAPFVKISRLSVQNELAAALGLTEARAAKAETGKPYLKAPDGSMRGLSISHVRRATLPLSFMAVTTRADFAIDAESWPAHEASSGFLTSVMTPQDKPLVEKLAGLCVDPAVSLWAVKEAALKASGEVMNDPRHLSATMSRNGHIWVESSATASAPLPPAQVFLFKFIMDPEQPAILLALAFAGLSQQSGADMTPNLQLVGAQGELQPLTLR